MISFFCCCSVLIYYNLVVAETLKTFFLVLTFQISKVTLCHDFPFHKSGNSSCQSQTPLFRCDCHSFPSNTKGPKCYAISCRSSTQRLFLSFVSSGSAFIAIINLLVSFSFLGTQHLFWWSIPRGLFQVFGNLMFLVMFCSLNIFLESGNTSNDQG